MHLYPIDGAVHLKPEPVDDVIYRWSSSTRRTRNMHKE